MAALYQPWDSDP